MRLLASRSTRVRDWSYGLALLGAHLAFMPLAILLLPRRVEVIAGGDTASTLSLILLIGAVAASLANIATGALGDHWLRRRGNRRLPLVIGLAVTLGSYALLGWAMSLIALVIAMLAFQLGVNAMLSPLTALLADHIPDTEKGRLAGLANAALPVSSATVAPLAWLYPVDDPLAFLLVGLLAVICCLPLVVTWSFGQAVTAAPDQVRRADPEQPLPGRDFALAWAGRFLIQLGAVVVTSYLYLYIAAQSGAGEAEIARRIGLLTGTAMLFATIAALASGRLSDRLARRRWPLAISAIAAAAALAILGSAANWPIIIAAYALFHTGLASFLAIDTALVAQLIADHPRRAALLGVMNLTNTLPSILIPGLTLIVLHYAPHGADIAQAFTLTALGCALAAAAVLSIRSVR